MPLYPLFSFVISFLIFELFKKLQSFRFLNTNIFVKAIPVVLVIALFFNPYYKSVNKGRKPKEYSWEIEFYNISYYLKDAVKSNKDLNDYSLLYNYYDAHLYFYAKLLRDKGQNFNIISADYLKENQMVIADKKELKDYIESNFNFEITEKFKNISIYKLENRK